jgi:uncharacterized damage-inducible protein DinB
MDPINSSNIRKPEADFHPDYYLNYFKWVDETPSILETWQHHIENGLAFWNDISEEESIFRYDSDKWTIKEVLNHILDVERIFGFRALSISRGEQAVLPGFDHNAYVADNPLGHRSWASLLQEYQHVKQATYDFFGSLSEAQWQKHGHISAGKVNMAALAYVIPGHDKHHQEIVKERYLRILRKA